MPNCYFRYVSIFIAAIFNAGLVAGAYSQVSAVYSYPIPNAIKVSPRTSIGIRYSETISRSSLLHAVYTVSGSQSGLHQGHIDLAEDANGGFRRNICSIIERIGIDDSNFCIRYGGYTKKY